MTADPTRSGLLGLRLAIRAGFAFGAIAALSACGGGDDSSGASANAAASPDPPSQEETLIVSGASGQLGGLVVEELLELGVDPSRLILVSRTPEELTEYEAMGAETRFGDFTQPESLDEAYAGGDRMLLISIDTGLGGERPNLHRNAIDAAVDAGVGHIAYTSFVDLDNNTSPIAADHIETEGFLRESGVAWTMLRNSLYMDGVAMQAAGMLEDGSVTVPPGDPGVSYVTRQDCAEAAAAVLATDGHENRAYDITGPAAVGPVEIARIASELSGVPVEIVEEEADGAAAGMAGGSFAVVSSAVEDLTGSPPTSVREFLEENLAEARSSGD